MCSGIEAASVAWQGMGWEAAWLSEIEEFPSAVLHYHWPETPNLGDMTLLAGRVQAGEIYAPPVIVGGTPCQAFSVAGARAGLADERGQLTIRYVELIDAVDEVRVAAGEEQCVAVWENVPGVLSSKDNAFGAFLGFLSGEECELVAPGGKWENAGYVHGPKRSIAWRVLDAQYFGVAQRRRRVFVVASAREGFDPTSVLFEQDGVRRDTPPSRTAGKAVASLTANGVGTCGADDNQGQAGHLIPVAGYRMQAFGVYTDDETASTMKARDYKDATDLAVTSVHGTQDPDTNVELAHTLGRNQGQENAILVKCSNAAKGWFEWLRKFAVRRLLPVECERLQGFPDNWTRIPVKKYAVKKVSKLRPEDMWELIDGEWWLMAADSPRYKALGNSMAVPCMRWIGRRLAAELERLDKRKGA